MAGAGAGGFAEGARHRSPFRVIAVKWAGRACVSGYVGGGWRVLCSLASCSTSAVTQAASESRRFVDGPVGDRFGPHPGIRGRVAGAGTGTGLRGHVISCLRTPDDVSRPRDCPGLTSIRTEPPTHRNPGHYPLQVHQIWRPRRPGRVHPRRVTTRVSCSGIAASFPGRGGVGQGSKIRAADAEGALDARHHD
jgi:hypothetical protein